MPMATVTMPKVVAVSIPVSRLLRHDAALSGNALSRQSIPPVSRKPLISRDARISRKPRGPGVKSGRAIDRLTRNRDGVSPGAIRRL